MLDLLPNFFIASWFCKMATPDTFLREGRDEKFFQLLLSFHPIPLSLM